MQRLLAGISIGLLAFSSSAFAQSTGQQPPQAGTVTQQNSSAGLDALAQAPPTLDSTALLIGGGVLIGGGALIAVVVNNNRNNNNNNNPVSP